MTHLSDLMETYGFSMPDVEELVDAYVQQLAPEDQPMARIPYPLFIALIAWQRGDYNAGKRLEVAVEAHAVAAMRDYVERV